MDDEREYQIGEKVDGYEIVDESYFLTPAGRLKRGVLDEEYISAYLENPKSKLGALKAAIYNCGINYKATRNRACVMHNRLLGEIESRLLKLSLDDKALGRSVLRDLCANAENESVKASTATTLAKGLYPDIQITKDMGIDEINLEISKLEKEQEHIH